MKPRTPIGVALTILLLGAAWSFAQEEHDTSATASDEPARRLIRQLGSDEYAARESAMRGLLESDVSVIPLLVKATDDSELEITWRVLSTLRMMAVSGDDLDKQDLAVAALEELCASANPAVAADARMFVRGSHTRHERAVIRLRQLGATVSHGDGKPTHVALGPNWQGGRHSLVHLARLDDLEELNMERAPIGDEQLADVRGLTHLQRLYLGGTAIRGAGLVHLVGMKNLGFVSLKSQQFASGTLQSLAGAEFIEHLGLDETNTADADLVHLEGLSNLKTLWLNKTAITDAGLGHLGKLPSLNKLILTGTNVGGAGLADLKQIDSLRFLSLQGVKISDGGAQYLAEVKQLETLGLDDTQIGDPGLARLKELANLKTLWLTNTRVTDAGIEHLVEMKKLEQVYIRGTGITDKGIERLKKELPMCAVFQ